MITESDSLNTVEFNKYYVILPNTFAEGKINTTREFYKKNLKPKMLKKVSVITQKIIKIFINKKLKVF